MNNESNKKITRKSKSINEQTDFERILALIDKHAEFIKSLRNNGKKAMAESRDYALNQIHSYNYRALMCKTISYAEFKNLNSAAADSLSWEKLYGVKQLSIFEELPE